MDVNILLDAISVVGFPIVMCLSLFWYIKYQNDEHVKEIATLRQAIENNTLIITKLYERMYDDDDK